MSSYLASMKTVREIKEAIEHLTLEQRAELIAELCGWSDDDWDRQMKTDAEVGKFSALNQSTLPGFTCGGEWTWPAPASSASQ